MDRVRQLYGGNMSEPTSTAYKKFSSIDMENTNNGQKQFYLLIHTLYRHQQIVSQPHTTSVWQERFSQQFNPRSHVGANALFNGEYYLIPHMTPAFSR